MQMGYVKLKDREADHASVHDLMNLLFWLRIFRTPHSYRSPYVFANKFNKNRLEAHHEEG